MNSKILKIKKILGDKFAICCRYGSHQKTLHIPVMSNEVLQHLVHESKDFKVLFFKTNF